MSVQRPWSIEAISVSNCVEWHVATSFAAHGLSPGCAVTEGDSRILHFTPSCLLVINHAGSMSALAVIADTIPVDVTGKWHGFRLRGSNVADVLAAGVHTDLVLNGRSCAALSLFDCPVVLSCIDGTYEVWVHASYAGSLCTALDKMEKML